MLKRFFLSSLMVLSVAPAAWATKADTPSAA